MGEEVAADDIANGKDVWSGRLEMFVYNDTSFICGDASVIQPQAFDVRRASEGNEERIGLEG